MDEIKRDDNRTARPETLAILEQLLANNEIRSAHYWGYAHEPILRLLVQRLGPKCSVFDYWDRFYCGAAFLCDDDVAHLIPDRPDWLEGIPFCVEGSPEAELYIYDVPLHAGRFVERLTLYGRPPPNFIVLTDEAQACAGHPDYRWTQTPFYALGVRRNRVERYQREEACDEEIPRN